MFAYKQNIRFRISHTFIRATLPLAFLFFLWTFGLIFVPKDFAACETVLRGFLWNFFFWKAFVISSLSRKLSVLFAFPSFQKICRYVEISIIFYHDHFVQRGKVFCPPIHGLFVIIWVIVQRISISNILVVDVFLCRWDRTAGPLKMTK